MEILLGMVLVIFAIQFWLKDRSEKESEKIRHDEKIALIRELSIAFKTKNIEEYTDSLPEYGEPEEPLEVDELVDIDSIEPDVLLRAISK